MKLNIKISLNLKDKEVMKTVTEAGKLAMRDTVSDVLNDSVKGSPVLTGNNRRSLTMEVSGFPGGGEGMVDQSKLEGAVYSTSGYGGFLEVGTRRTGARPYIKPAAQKHVPEFPKHLKEHL